MTNLAGPQRSTAPTPRKLAGKVADSNRVRLSPSEQRARAATLERYAAELLDLPVDRVGSRAAGLIEVDPVAAVAGRGARSQPAVRQHMRSVPCADEPAAMQRIEMCRATLSAKACLRCQILTAARPSEARLATWGEIAEDAREWRIPACRMKRGREHVVPLVPAVVALLDVNARRRFRSECCNLRWRCSSPHLGTSVRNAWSHAAAVHGLFVVASLPTRGRDFR